MAFYVAEDDTADKKENGITATFLGSTVLIGASPNLFPSANDMLASIKYPGAEHQLIYGYRVPTLEARVFGGDVALHARIMWAFVGVLRSMEYIVYYVETPDIVMLTNAAEVQGLHTYLKRYITQKAKRKEYRSRGYAPCIKRARRS